MGKFSPYVTKAIFMKCRQLCLVWPKSYKICACPWEPKKEPSLKLWPLYSNERKLFVNGGCIWIMGEIFTLCHNINIYLVWSKSYINGAFPRESKKKTQAQIVVFILKWRKIICTIVSLCSWYKIRVRDYILQIRQWFLIDNRSCKL